MTETRNLNDVRVEGVVVPTLPLALLESVRAHDRPAEVLEDEDLTVSLPRRFGLSDVVLAQIQRYETARTAGRRVPVQEVVDLLKLVLRRPDATAVLREAGRTVARWRYGHVFWVRGRVWRLLPGAAVFVKVRRATRRLLRGLVGAGRVSVRRPLTVAIASPPTAGLDGVACGLYAGAIEEVLRLFAGRARTLVHGRCAARGDAACEWSLGDA
jgi:hypothetical protein